MTVTRGLSMVESTVVLGVLVGLAAVVSPVVRSTVEHARCERARTDARTLQRAVATMLNDTGEAYVLKRGHGRAITDPPDRSWANRVHLLVTQGRTPAVGAERSHGTDWSDPLDDDVVSRFDVHLVTNAAGYRSPSQMTGLGLATSTRGTGWRGAYLVREIGTDPWGHRYAANVERIGGGAVVVLSAGRDGRVDTPFMTDPPDRRGDDIVVADGSLEGVEGDDP